MQCDICHNMQRMHIMFLVQIVHIMHIWSAFLSLDGLMKRLTLFKFQVVHMLLFALFPVILTPMNPLHWLFDKWYPVIRFVYERIQKHAWFEQVTSQLWQGGAPTYDRDYDFILKNGIDAVLDVRAEREDDRLLFDNNGISYLKIPVLDVMVPAAEQLDEGTAFIRQQIEAGNSILVHCAKGRGRSASMLAAYLMRYEGYTYEQAKELLVSKRALTNLQRRHERTLKSWMNDFSRQDPAQVEFKEKRIHS